MVVNMQKKAKEKICVVLAFNLSSFDNLADYATADISPLVEKDDGKIAEYDPAESYNIPTKSNLDIIGELTSAWIRTIKNHRPLLEKTTIANFNLKGDECTYPAHVAYFETMAEAHSFLHEFGNQPSSKPTKRAFKQNKIVLFCSKGIPTID